MTRRLLRGPRAIAAGGLLLLGAALLLHGTWIPVKAAVAQVLLERSWQAHLEGDVVKPWPWADAQPIARLIVPRLDVDMLVLNNASGRSLAFGPVWVDPSAPLGGYGNSVLSGHRDTHFEFLRHLREGDRIIVQTTGGMETFEVRSHWVFDQRDEHIVLSTLDRRLTLVTCYPFDSIVPGGDLRFAIEAVAVGVGDRSS